MRPTTLWLALLAASVPIAAGAGWMGFVASSAPDESRVLNSKISGARADTTRASATAEHLADDVAASEWKGEGQNLETSVLDAVAGMVAGHGVQLADFRSSKPLSLARLREAPFLVVLRGSFTDVAAVLRSFESPKSKLAVTMVEISPEQKGAGSVTATIGLIALIPEVQK